MMKILLAIITSCFLVQANVERKLPYKIKGPKSFHDKIAIVGAGPSGIYMAYLLKQKGFTNIHILEKSSRVGGKVHTVYHRNTALNFGAVFFADNFPHIHKLAKAFLPNEIVRVPEGGVLFDGEEMSFQEFYIYYIRNVLAGIYKKMDDQSIYGDIFKAMNRYDDLFDQIFGRFDGAVLPNPKNPDLIKGTFQDFLVRSNLTILIPVFMSITQIYGYNYLDMMSAFYGLAWNNVHSNSPINPKVHSKIYMFKCGYQKLWQVIVEKERLRVTFNVDIQKVYREYNDSRPQAWLYMARGNKHAKWEHFDFLIWSPEMQTSMKRWVNKIPQERKLLSKTIPTHYTVSIVDSKDEQRMYSTTSFPENMIEAGDGRVLVKVDTFASLNHYDGPKYQSRQYPMGNDNKPITTYVTFQQSIPRRPDQETKQFLINQFRNLSASSIKIVNSKTWRYFPRYSVSDIEDGVFWKIIEMQGKYGMWYIGSSVYFESVHHVTSYSAFLVENMKIPIN